MALDFSTLTPDQLAQLASAIQKSQLTAVQTEMDKQQGEQLHNEKNAPWAPGGYYEKALKNEPPYRFREYPKMLYSTDYVTAQRDYEAAIRYRERRDDPGVRDQMLRDALAAMKQASRIAASSEEEDRLRETGLWAASPLEALAAEDMRQRAMAEAAAVARYDDRRLSDSAMAERDAVDAASEGHLVEVPEQKRRSKVQGA